MQRLVIVLIALAGLASLPARAEERIALVVGNGGYEAVSALPNPVSDASLIAGTLGDLGFDVTLLTDVGQDAFKNAVAEFGRRLRAGGPETVGLFYYAGHGVQSFGANYLLPVDAAPTDAADLDLVALEAASVLRQMASARNRTNIVILDACRNNPFEALPALDESGLAEMKAPTGTFLSYATAPGAVALDGTGGNSPFTAALAVAMRSENTPIEQVFKQVRVEVIAETGGAQTPWDTSSLTRDFVFRPGERLTPEEVAEDQLWRSVAESGDPVQIMLFLRTYPKGRHEAAARALLADTMAKELAGTASAAAPAPAPAPAAGPSEGEAPAFEAARGAGTADAYEAFLQAFPDGTFAALARIEVAALAEAARAQSATPAAAPAPESAGAGTPEAGPGEAPPVFYDTPVALGPEAILGLTIAEITKGSPLFAPIEGLPAEMWEGQSCSTCHSWTPKALCEQGRTYLKANAERALSKQHPFGGAFKGHLRDWAAADCN